MRVMVTLLPKGFNMILKISLTRPSKQIKMGVLKASASSI